MENKKEKSVWDDVNFFEGIEITKPSLTEEQLKRKLENDYSIFRKFDRNGYITNVDYSFITRSTFDDEDISISDGKRHGSKTEEQRNQAKKMCQIVEDYLNSNEPREPVKVSFIYRRDTECALYNANRFNYDKINSILMEYFS